MERLRPCFPKSRGVPRVDDRRVLRGIIFFNRNGLRWRDAPREYGPHKMLYNRWKRWSDMGGFARIIIGLSAEAPDNKTISIYATYPRCPHHAKPVPFLRFCPPLPVHIGARVCAKCSGIFPMIPVPRFGGHCPSCGQSSTDRTGYRSSLIGNVWNWTRRTSMSIFKRSTTACARSTGPRSRTL